MAVINYSQKDEKKKKNDRFKLSPKEGLQWWLLIDIERFKMVKLGGQRVV